MNGGVSGLLGLKGLGGLRGELGEPKEIGEIRSAVGSLEARCSGAHIARPVGNRVCIYSGYISNGSFLCAIDQRGTSQHVQR